MVHHVDSGSGWARGTIARPFRGWMVAMVAWLWGYGATARAVPLREGPPPVEVRAGNESDPLHFGLGASVWMRGQVRHEADATRWQIPTRTRARVDARWRGLRGVVQLQDVRRLGSTPDLSTSATTGVHQGYLELRGSRGAASGFVRLGRQQHALGSMRMLGTAPWHPNMRSLDALRVHGEHGRFTIDALGALMRHPGTLSVEGEAGDTRTVHHAAEGLLAVAVRARVHRALDVESYVLARNYAPTVDEPTRDRVVFSPGARVLGNPWRGFHYELEGYVQSGRWDGVPHDAWLGSATVGYAWNGGARPRLDLGYVAASGGGCERVGDALACDRQAHRDFDGLLGARHRFYGIGDLFAPTNAHDGWFGVRVSPGGWAELRAEFHHLALHDPAGRWVRTNDAPVGAGPLPENHRRTLGEELDFRVSLHPWGPLKAQVGYAVFVPTGAGPRLVGRTPIQFGYVGTQLAF